MRLHRQLPTDRPVLPSTCINTAIVVRGGSDLEQVLGRTEALGNGLGRSVTVIAIASMHWMVRSGAIGTGLMTVDAIDEVDLQQAAATARHLATMLPQHLEVRHLAFSAWNAPIFVGALRTHTFDTVYLISLPGWKNRLAVVRAAQKGGTQLISRAPWYSRYALRASGGRRARAVA
jgi:hypothetical protein